MKTLTILLLAYVALAPLGVVPPHSQAGFNLDLAHSGGTDKCGCHYNRKTGEYHCHKRKKRGGDCPA